MSREHYNTWTRIRAVLTSPTVYELGRVLEPEHLVGRRPENPAYVVLAYGVMARILRSGIRVELDLAEGHTWAAARNLMIRTIAERGLDLPPPGARPPKWDHWRFLRNHHLATEDGLGLLGREFPPIAVAAARRIGLLDPHGPGSLTHPDQTRVTYGDGTLVRPLYRPPAAVTVENDDGTTSIAYPDPRTGQLLAAPPHRFDPDLQAHHGRAGPVLTHGYVCWHARGPHPYERIDLAAGHIPAPGAEAATAVELLRDVHRAAGTGIQLVVYDGALRGTHIETIMRNYGYAVLAKQHADAAGDDREGLSLVKTPNGHRARSIPLGTIAHDLPNRTCRHHIAAAAGQVVEIDLDDSGDPVVVSTLSRSHVKRQRRRDGHYHFNVGYQLACPYETVTVWLSPHPDKNAAPGDHRRPEQLRILPTGDPDALRLAGIRSDAESFHSNYKRTLIVNRAMSKGWQRGLIDLYCFTVLNNALAEHRHAEQTQPNTRRLSALGPTGLTSTNRLA
ncbi:hypothetical protein [Nocardioides aequoreus]|uniref:hypothetical protein n=1 Tax=Nocardioides aequoreus TaxID=397278 RepID=UPI000AFA279F|nr:hypothetical protein [Nocardioides aequoreus]